MKAGIIRKPKARTGVRSGKSNSTARIDARVSRKLKDKIEQAAHLRGQTVTDFLTGVLDEVASRIIMEETSLQLHIDDQKRLAEILVSDKPFPPMGRMSRLRRYAADYAGMVERK